MGVEMPWADQMEEVLDRCLVRSRVRSGLVVKMLSSESALVRLVGECG